MIEAHCILKRSIGMFVALMLLVMAPSSRANGQTTTHWVVDPTTSLAWWQMNPNYGHLWATTCPGDPSWHAGEGHTNGFDNGKGETKHAARAANLDYRIPLYPRGDVSPVCRKAVIGQIQVADPKNLKGIHGFVYVNTDSLETGSELRDRFAHKLLAGNTQVEFQLDSLLSVQPGDTIHGTAVGTFSIHGNKQPLMVLFTAFPTADGMRVQGKWQMHPRELTVHFGLSKFALGAGVGMDLWKELHLGFDLLLKPAPGQGTQ